MYTSTSKPWHGIAQIITIQTKLRGKMGRAKSRQQGFKSKEEHLKHTINVEHLQKEYLLSTRDKSKMIRHSREARNDDDEETWSRDGTSTGNQGEEDNTSAADSSDDEAVHSRHVVNRNNTSTPQNSGGTTSNNQLQAASSRENGLPTTVEMMAAWQLHQQQQEHAQHNDDNYGDNGRINAAGKRALCYRVAKQLQEKNMSTLAYKAW